MPRHAKRNAGVARRPLRRNGSTSTERERERERSAAIKPNQAHQSQSDSLVVAFKSIKTLQKADRVDKADHPSRNGSIFFCCVSQWTAVVLIPRRFLDAIVRRPGVFLLDWHEAAAASFPGWLPGFAGLARPLRSTGTGSTGEWPAPKTEQARNTKKKAGHQGKRHGNQRGAVARCIQVAAAHRHGQEQRCTSGAGGPLGGPQGNHGALARRHDGDTVCFYGRGGGSGPLCGPPCGPPDLDQESTMKKTVFHFDNAPRWEGAVDPLVDPQVLGPGTP